jgi:hypothetical protein
VFSSIACPFQHEDFGFVHEPISDRGGHGSGVEHLCPVGKGQI